VLPFSFYALVDARMSKHPGGTAITSAPFVIGLGPGFAAGTHCHAVVETKRGHTLGRVHWSGGALPDTSSPDGDARRVLRAPADGVVVAHADIGQHVDAGQLVCEVAGQPVASPLAGVLRGLIRPGTAVAEGVKIGDVDARDVQHHCYLVSDKALAVGGGVLEALLSRPEIRARLSD
jgi:xanthine dehydrogenase accessory factor